MPPDLAFALFPSVSLRFTSLHFTCCCAESTRRVWQLLALWMQLISTATCLRSTVAQSGYAFCPGTTSAGTLAQETIESDLLPVCMPCVDSFALSHILPNFSGQSPHRYEASQRLELPQSLGLEPRALLNLRLGRWRAELLAELFLLAAWQSGKLDSVPPDQLLCVRSSREVALGQLEESSHKRVPVWARFCAFAFLLRES